MFDKDAMVAALKTRWLGRQCHVHDSLESTNTEARRLAEQGAAHGVVVIADEQRAGKGRLGRRWQSPAGCNLYFSSLLRPTVEPQHAPLYSLATAVGLADALGPLITRGELRLKWPNDVLIDEGKLCGVLIELKMNKAAIASLVVGVGINVNCDPARDLGQELSGSATSLIGNRGQALERRDVLLACLEQLERRYDQLANGERAAVVAAFSERACYLGEPVMIAAVDGERRGVAKAFDADGALLLQDEAGDVSRVLAGDLHRLRPL